MITLSLFLLSSCNPFSRTSFLNVFDSIEPDLLNQKTQIQLVSGGTKTSPSISFSESTVTHLTETTVGTAFQESVFVTSKGDILELSVGGVQK